MIARLVALAVLTVASQMWAHAALNIFPLKDLRAGMRGVGKTVFQDDKVEDFQVEILGVLENTGPRQSIILGKLSGGPLQHTGVMQGMSGSPVYIDGRLVGAVALAFPFAKDPIAGIRPIEEMLSVGEGGGVAPKAFRTAIGGDLAGVFPARPATLSGDMRMTEVATPLSLSGFTANAVEQFASRMKALGLEPRQGISMGGAPSGAMGDPSKLQPGSMISVELMTGDLSVGADGTLTAIDEGKVYAFGHRFLAIGPTELPFTRSEVITLLANTNTSFKISSARELMGVISQDRNTAVAGFLGKRAATVPLEINVTEARGAKQSYKMQMVNDRFLSPFLLQMAVFSAIDATERSLGSSSIALKGTIEFENRAEPARIANIYAADGGSAMQAAINTAVPLSYIMQGGFDALKVKRIAIELTSFEEKRDLTVGAVYLSKKEVKPGDTVELLASLEGSNGREISRGVKYTIPPGTAPGILFFTVADGAQTSLAELRQVLAQAPHSAEQLVATVNRLKASDKAYVRVWRAEPAYEVQGEEMPDPPPSVALILGAGQNFSQNRNSKVGEMTIDTGGLMVTGSKTVQVEVKE